MGQPRPPRASSEPFPSGLPHPPAGLHRPARSASPPQRASKPPTKPLDRESARRPLDENIYALAKDEVAPISVRQHDRGTELSA